MKGGIYSSERCALCGAKMQDNGRAVACPKHPRQKAAGLRVMLRTNGEWVTRRFKDYDQATRFLTGLRFKIQEGSFDARDYQADNPLGFGNLARQWLALKMTQIKRHSWDSLNNTMQKAMALWEHKNIKEVQYAELEDFLTVHLENGHAGGSDGDPRRAAPDRPSPGLACREIPLDVFFHPAG